MSEPLVIDDETLERLRRSGIRIDREGHFVHEGERVSHPGFKAALHRWLQRLPPPDGRHILRLDDRRYAYVDVDDTPLVARGAQIQDQGLQLFLSDGSQPILPAATLPNALNVDDEGVLRCQVDPRGLEARLSTAAMAAIEPALEERDGSVWLTQPQAFAIPRRASAQPRSSRK